MHNIKYLPVPGSLDVVASGLAAALFLSDGFNKHQGTIFIRVRRIQGVLLDTYISIKENNCRVKMCAMVICGRTRGRIFLLQTCAE